MDVENRLQASVCNAAMKTKGVCVTGVPGATHVVKRGSCHWSIHFGFAFNPFDSSQFIVSDAFAGATNAGALTSYQLHNDKVKLEDGPVADHQTAPCWVAITGNGRFAYTANADSNSISGYSLGQNGTLTLL